GPSGRAQPDRTAAARGVPGGVRGRPAGGRVRRDPTAGPGRPVSGAATLAGLAAALVVVALAELRATRMRRGRRRSLRLLVLELLARLGRRVGVPTPGADVAARLDAAGRPFGLRPADVMAARAGGAALGLALALPLAAAMPGHLGVIVPFALALTGLLGPDLWLARRARRRARAVETEL